MVEIMHMKHLFSTATKLVRGLVLDHGARHPDMPKSLENCFILTCNVSMEYEKSEVNSSLFYSNADQRVQLANAERKMTDLTVNRAIALKRKVCDSPDKHFVIVNQKGIDPTSLQMLADEGIIALRRAKRRNMERITLACGGTALNALEDDIDPSVLGHADHVYEYVLGEDKYTFIEGCATPKSCTVLLMGPDDHTIGQLKDAARDGLRAVNNAIKDKALIPGAGAFEIELSRFLMKEAENVPGKAKIGVKVFADAVLVIPKVLAENAGFDSMDTILALQEAAQQNKPCGLDLNTGKPMDPTKEGVWDNYCVKKQLIGSAPVVAHQLLLVDVIMRAGKSAPQISGNHPVQ
jgi:T-complex protein 1 subunit zeta